MIKASVIGATGYAGGELVRLLALHQEVELLYLAAKDNIGKKIEEVYPHLRRFVDNVVVEPDIEQIAQASDVVFIAVPHGQSVPLVKAVAGFGKKVIDFGADFRFRNTAVYNEWYQVRHEEPGLAQEAVYGLPEINREKVKNSTIIGNPGCYPTSAILALYPLVKNKLIDLDTIIIDSKSGISGAGRKLAVGSLFAEAAGSFKAYSVARHRHTPEIEQALSEAAGREVFVSFTPHLVPMTRGILTTVYANLNKSEDGLKINELYRTSYQNEFFIRVQSEGVWPQTKWVAGTNFCDIGVAYDPRTNRVIISSAIDNLVKGAAGQAVQNMNVAFGLLERTGLEIIPIYP
ncbi:MAG: N-acetyl-gamma-glutamyl-phosphate reductase [Bacillota bacterium]|jgi:N-acetyl-gamma-glutamyl-phosphate reductase